MRPSEMLSNSIEALSATFRLTGSVTMRVAVLQIDSQHRFVIGEIVERLGHTCLPFGDGLAMSKALSRSTVDMLILDWNSSGLTGLDLLKSMRLGGGERVPVLFASTDSAE